MADDGYVSWYQGKLWQLLPAIYRTDDALTPGVPGPLQELFNRMGVQAATIRRSIDRLWENQSIETCDDWVVPYIGDLLATRLVSCLDARAQRLDVAKTIYYRRRAGTLGLLEELVADIAGRDARAVEFFRRLGRVRHQFDPPIGNAFAADIPAWAPDTIYAAGTIVSNDASAYVCAAGGISAAAGGPSGAGAAIADGGVTWNFDEPLGSLVPTVIEGLAGADSRTPAGGFADLRNTYADRNTHPRSTSSPTTPICARARNPPVGTTSPTSACSSGGSRASRCWPRRRSGTASRRLLHLRPEWPDQSIVRPQFAHRSKLRRRLGRTRRMAAARRRA